MVGATVFTKSILTDPEQSMGCRTAQALVDSKQRVIDVCSAPAEMEIGDAAMMTIRSTLRAEIKKWRQEVDKAKADLPQCFESFTKRV